MENGASNRNSQQAPEMQDSWERENLLTGSEGENISSSSHVFVGVTNYQQMRQRNRRWIQQSDRTNNCWAMCT